MEIGDKTVQGADFVYTLQGWLKGVNRNTLGGTNNAYSARDIGLDAVNSGSNINRNVGSDAYGFGNGPDYHLQQQVDENQLIMLLKAIQ